MKKIILCKPGKNVGYNMNLLIQMQVNTLIFLFILNISKFLGECNSINNGLCWKVKWLLGGELMKIISCIHLLPDAKRTFCPVYMQ